ncbi:hypothetical protein [Saudi moumouvirus]|nr:hypothetical protein [Saudi moumouvirus]
MKIYIMSSVFFQISPFNYLEASRTHSRYKDFALRIITYKEDGMHFVYLPEVTLDELSVLASILQAKILPNISNYRYLFY